MTFVESLLILFFISTIFFHLAKKNIGVAYAYSFQSLLIVILLFNSFLETKSISLFFVAFLVFVIKVIITPIFIVKLIKKHQLKFLVSTYTSMPVTLVVVTILAIIANSSFLVPLTSIIPSNQQSLSLALSSLFISLFLIINRKGALSQIIGVLSLENSIVAFAFFAGLEQTLALQIGIIFDIFVWMVIATVFISMIYKHFGTLNVSEMQHLKD